MDNIWFTSDQHFGHRNIIKYSNRPFKDTAEMDRVLIERWNEKVQPQDCVYQIGDFTLTSNLEYVKGIFSQLNGKIYFVRGSHDQWDRKLEPIKSRDRSDVEYLGGLYTLEIPIDAQYPMVIVLCHYAMRVWDRSHYGSYHLYGHSHGNLGGQGRSMDVGVDTHDFYPYSLDEVTALLSDAQLTANH